MKRLLTAISVFTVSIAAIAQVETIALNHGANLDAKIYDDTLYIASDEGLYAYPLNVKPATWKLYAFGNRKVFNFVKSGPCLLAVTDETEVSGRQLSLQQSNDYGRTFTDVTPADASIKSEYNDFSGNVMQLWQHPKDQDMIYLAYPGTYGSGSVFDNSTMLASSDFGLQWKKKNKTPPCNARLAFSSNNASHIIACGLYPNVDCSCPYISETKDDFQNMTNVSYDIVDQDAKTIFHYNGIMATSEILFYQVAFSPDSDQQLIAATTSGIAKSEDGGLTWKFTLEDISPGHYEYMGKGLCELLFDKRHPQTVYAVRNNGLGGQLYISQNCGSSWQPVLSNQDSLSFPEIYNMLLHNGKLYLIARYNGVQSLSLDNISTSIAMPSTVMSADGEMLHDLNGIATGHANSKKIYIRNGKKFVVK